MQMSKWSENTQGRGGGSERRRSEGTKEKSDEDENSEKKDEEKKAKNLHEEIEEAIFHNLQEVHVEACNSDCLLFSSYNTLAFFCLHIVNLIRSSFLFVFVSESGHFSFTLLLASLYLLRKKKQNNSSFLYIRAVFFRLIRLSVLLSLSELKEKRI